jgi:hypothetical protein
MALGTALNVTFKAVIGVATCAIFLPLAGCDNLRVAATRAAIKNEKPKAYAAQFVDATGKAGVSFRQFHGGCGDMFFIEQVASGAAFLDANGDGFLDIYFPQPQPMGRCKSQFKEKLTHRLYLNDGQGRFKLAPEAFGGVGTDYGIGASTADYDNDGDVDLYVTCYGRSTLFRNKGDGTFEDVTTKAGVGLRGLSTSSAWIDYDNDGDLDLYVARYCEWNIEMDKDCTDGSGRPTPCAPLAYTATADAFYRNNGNGTFSDVTRQAGLSNVKWRGQEGRGLGVAAFDVNTDGRLDLFVSNDLSPNYLFINQGNGKFRDMAMPMDAAYGLSGDPLANMGIAVGDYNDDAHPDVLITEFQSQGYVLYRNNGGMDFTNVSGTTGVFKATLPFLAFGAGFVDTRNNGSLDLFFANGHVSPSAKYQDPNTSFKQRNQLMLNDGKGQFTDVPAALPKDDIRVHRGASFGDYDNDGRVDILVTAADDRPTLLHNQSTAGNWLLLKLTNKQGCVTPIGTRCVATINGQKKVRLVLGGGSYASESDHRVHFGLGNADKVEKLEIQWLSGHRQTLENIEANQILSVREGSSPS